MMDSHYITLPANSSARYYADNKNSHFYTKLQERIVLKDGLWEVALVDLQYPCNWDNVTEGKIYLHRNYPSHESDARRDDDGGVERLAEKLQADEPARQPTSIRRVKERAYYYEDDPKKPSNGPQKNGRTKRDLSSADDGKEREAAPIKIEDDEVWRMLAKKSETRYAEPKDNLSPDHKHDEAVSAVAAVTYDPQPNPKRKKTLPSNHLHETRESAGTAITHRRLRDRYEISLRRGREEDPGALVARINKIIEEQELPGIRFYYDAYTNSCHSDNTSEHMVYMSDDLSNIFGFEKRWHGNVINESVRRTDITAGFHSIFVYSDMAAKRTVGDAQVPLLRSVPAKGKRNEMVHVTFTDRQYVRASGMDNDVVETRLSKEDGSDVGFQGGSSPSPYT